MSRKKRTSRILEKAQLRSAGLKSIVPSIKFDEDYPSSVTLRDEQVVTK